MIKRPKTRHYEFLRPYAPSTPPEADILALTYGLGQGKSFKRRLTARERLVLALTSAPPTAFVTLDSAGLSRPEATKAWDLLIKRLRRNLHNPCPPIYLGAPARHKAENAGCHIHALFWHYVHRPTLAKHARAVGFGSEPCIKPVPSPALDDDGCVGVLTYVVAQDEPVFGSTHHDRHAAAEASAWSLLHPQGATLKQHCPQLFTALTSAKSQLVSDKTLAERSPLFSRDIRIIPRSTPQLYGGTR